jgi:hypothetical protein
LAGNATAYYDLFLVQDGLIVEHWDVIQAISPAEEFTHDNGKFEVFRQTSLFFVQSNSVVVSYMFGVSTAIRPTTSPSFRLYIVVAPKNSSTRAAVAFVSKPKYI